MIEVKQAVKAAKTYLLSVYDSSEIRDVLLEEVELTEDGKSWNITLGFSTPEPPADPFSPAGGLASQMSALFPKSMRKYKLFKVNSDDGIVSAMKIRNV